VAVIRRRWFRIVVTLSVSCLTSASSLSMFRAHSFHLLVGFFTRHARIVASVSRLLAHLLAHSRRSGGL
jgi:hypothetical protein